MGSQGNNTSAEYAHLRDTFFGIDSHHGHANLNAKGNGELDYLRELLEKYPKARKLHDKFLKMDPRVLYEEAMKLITLIESGQVPAEELETVEAQIALLLAGLEDLHLVKVLEKTLDAEDLGMSL